MSPETTKDSLSWWWGFILHKIYWKLISRLQCSDTSYHGRSQSKNSEADGMDLLWKSSFPKFEIHLLYRSLLSLMTKRGG